MEYVADAWQRTLGREEATRELHALTTTSSYEEAHWAADTILVAALRGAGLTDVADAYLALMGEVGFYWA